MDDNILDSYLKYICNAQVKTFDLISDLNNVVNNQGMLLHNAIQVINLQSQSLNEINFNVKNLLSKLSDIEIRNNISEESLMDILQNVNQSLQSIEDVKLTIDNLKVYNVVEDNRNY